MKDVPVLAAGSGSMGSPTTGLHTGVSQNEGYLFGGPLRRIIVIWGLCWGPPISGNYHTSSTLYQDPPCTLNWGYMVPNSGYLGPNKG